MIGHRYAFSFSSILYIPSSCNTPPSTVSLRQIKPQVAAAWLDMASGHVIDVLLAY